MNATDEALLAAYGSSRCEASFAELFRRHNAKLCHFLVRKYGLFDRQTVDEIAQEAWVRVAKNAAWPVVGFRSWLYFQARQAAGVWFTYKNRGQRKKEKPSDFSIPREDSRIPQPLDEVIANDELSAARSALEKLDPAERAILWAIFSDGVNEVEACGLPAAEWPRARQIVNQAIRAFVRAFSQADGASSAAEALEQIDDDAARRRFGVPLAVVKNLEAAPQAAAVLHYLFGASASQIAWRSDIEYKAAWRRLNWANAAIKRHHAAQQKFGKHIERLKKIDGRFYLVARLRLIEGAMMRDIGKRLGIAQPTAREWLKRAEDAMAAWC